MPLPKALPDWLLNPWAEMVFGMLGQPSAVRSGGGQARQRPAGGQRVGNVPVASEKGAPVSRADRKPVVPAAKPTLPKWQDYWEPRHEDVECLDTRDCEAQLMARREARDWRNGETPQWQRDAMKQAFGDDGSIRRPDIVEKKRRQPKVLRDHDEWCQDMSVDVANSLWARPSSLRGAGEGMTHDFYDQTLNYELERMRAFDDNKLGGRTAAKVITEVPLAVAPKFATGSKPYRKLKDIFGNYLQDSATEAEQLDAVRRLADYHALCEHRRWGE